MPTLHRYLLRHFLASFFICAVSVMALYVVIDLSTNLETFLEAGRDRLAGFLAAYYLYRAPLLFGKLCPLIALLAAAFTLTFLEKRNELDPVKASGVPLRRLLRPLLAFAVLLGGMNLALEQWVVPWAAKQIYMRNLEKSDPHLWNQTVRDREDDLYLFYVAYYPATARMERIYATRVDGAMREREFLYALWGRFEEDASGEGAWVLREGYRLRFDPQGFRKGPPEPFDVTVLETRLKPSDMEHQALADEMPLSALARSWREQPEAPPLGVRFHFRAALTLASPLLMLLGLPIVLRGAHTRYFLGAATTALLAGAYFGVTFLGLHFGMNGTLPPWIAGWGPVVLFGAIAAATYDLIPT